MNERTNASIYATWIAKRKTLKKVTRVSVDTVVSLDNDEAVLFGLDLVVDVDAVGQLDSQTRRMEELDLSLGTTKNKKQLNHTFNLVRVSGGDEEEE